MSKRRYYLPNRVPVGSRCETVIRSEYDGKGLVTVWTDRGGMATFTCERAYIDASLRMVLVGIPRAWGWEPIGGPELDAFTRGYIEAMLFETTADEDSDDSLEEAGYTMADLSSGTMARIVADCAAFQRDNEEILDAAYQASGEKRHGQTLRCDPASAGADLWFTRGGSGCGFWDGDWAESVEDALTASAKGMGHVGVYVGDDGLVYQVGCENAELGAE